MQSLIRCSSLSLYFLLGLCQAKTPDWFNDYAADVQTQARKHNVPGYVFALIEKGQPALIVNYGKTEKRGSAIDRETVFRLASVSKTFTAALIAKMVENKQLHWQTSVSTLAPEFGFSQNGKGKMNLTHLLGQSSGFIPNAYDNLIEANYPLKRVLSKLADLEPLCSPGRCYTYQNTLFGVLEYYFDQHNTSYGTQLQQQLLRPLGMHGASVGKATLLAAAKWAKPHIAINRKKWRKSSVKPNYYRFSPAAGVNASIQDMVVWVRAMLGERPDVISPGLIETLTRPRVRTKREIHRRGWRKHLRNAHYGLGWRVYDFAGHKLNYHGGWVQGYRADVAFAPDAQVGYAMLMNAESNLINGFTADFWARFFAQLEKQKQTAKLTEQVGE